MSHLKIAIQTASLRQSFKRALITASHLGADGVEIDARTEIRPAQLSQTGLRQLRRTLEDLRLRVSAISFPTRRGYDDVEDLDRRIAATGQAMKMAYELGAKVVINRLGPLPSDASDARHDALRASLIDLGGQGHRVGATLALRTGGQAGTEIAQLLSDLPERTIGVSLDPHAQIVANQSVEETVSAIGSSIVHVHANDAVRDLSLGRGLEVTLGRGSTDFPALLGQLEEFAYREWFTIERHECDDPVTEIGDAVQYLRSL